ncbi:FAD-binding, type 2 [Metarhizium robertsii ARSEF 23]|uniref:FAD-binding, type 2 n=1 Tax=Metarhizium robertsii (strain ARSEF 23 / ATCC MYA-3075) TaxID=655844 RepID=A0A0B2XG43_METRA|nr:FAD-binding, type 2 [Metarhizium robertsii ARSEF 23]KHO11640.1 FAD-binding, type 2 [Metarhizium robertsii ARSEF 23]
MLKLTAYGVFASFLIDNVQPIPVTSVTLVAGLTINIEQQALDLSLIDLLQAFGMTLPAPRDTVSKMVVNKRGNAEDFREEAYTRAGTMTYPERQSNANTEDFREEVYTRAGTVAYPKVVEGRSIDVYSSLLIRDNLT